MFTGQSFGIANPAPVPAHVSVASSVQTCLRAIPMMDFDSLKRRVMLQQQQISECEAAVNHADQEVKNLDGILNGQLLAGVTACMQKNFDLFQSTIRVVETLERVALERTLSVSNFGVRDLLSSRLSQLVNSCGQLVRKLEDEKAHARILLSDSQYRRSADRSAPSLMSSSAKQSSNSADHGSHEVPFSALLNASLMLSSLQTVNGRDVAPVVSSTSFVSMMRNEVFGKKRLEDVKANNVAVARHLETVLLPRVMGFAGVRPDDSRDSTKDALVSGKESKYSIDSVPKVLDALYRIKGRLDGADSALKSETMSEVYTAFEKALTEPFFGSLEDVYCMQVIAGLAVSQARFASHPLVGSLVYLSNSFLSRSTIPASSESLPRHSIDSVTSMLCRFMTNDVDRWNQGSYDFTHAARWYSSLRALYLVELGSSAFRDSILNPLTAINGGEDMSTTLRASYDVLTRFVSLACRNTGGHSIVRVDEKLASRALQLLSRSEVRQDPCLCIILALVGGSAIPPDASRRLRFSQLDVYWFYILESLLHGRDGSELPGLLEESSVNTLIVVDEFASRIGPSALEGHASGPSRFLRTAVREAVCSQYSWVNSVFEPRRILSTLRGSVSNWDTFSFFIYSLLAMHGVQTSRSSPSIESALVEMVQCSELVSWLNLDWGVRWMRIIPSDSGRRTVALWLLVRTALGSSQSVVDFETRGIARAKDLGLAPEDLLEVATLLCDLGLLRHSLSCLGQAFSGGLSSVGRVDGANILNRLKSLRSLRSMASQPITTASKNHELGDADFERWTAVFSM